VAFSILQLSLGTSLLGSVVVVTLPVLVKDFRSSRLAEPLDGLRDIAMRATALAALAPPERAYPASAPLTPSRVPGARPLVDPPGTWDHPSWRLLDFRKEGAHSYAFQFDSTLSPQGSTFLASAFGDIDADGTLSEFAICGEARPSGEPLIYPVQIYREVE
jgi:hypothetical protein